MTEIFEKFSIRFITESIRRVKMDDATYFSSEYSDYVSNSKLGLLNPAQGGSPQKFLEGFKSSGNTSFFSLGSAVHQLTLEHEDYVLSDLTKPAFKLGIVYDFLIEKLSAREGWIEALQRIGSEEDGFIKFIDIAESDPKLEKHIVNAFLKADYYTSEITTYKGTGLPSRIKSGLLKIFPYFIAQKPNTNSDGQNIIYLTSDLHTKCVLCTNSLKACAPIQNALRWKESYCEDVILADVEVTFPKDFNDDFSEMISTIVKVKIKIDNWTIDHDKRICVLNDLKTTGKPIQYFMGREVMELGFMGTQEKKFIPGSWQKFHYHRQMGMYLCFLKKYIDKEFGSRYNFAANMLVVETCGAQASALFPVSQADIVSGFYDFINLLKRAAFHQVNGYESILELAISKEQEFNLEL